MDALSRKLIDLALERGRISLAGMFAEWVDEAPDENIPAALQEFITGGEGEMLQDRLEDAVDAWMQLYLPLLLQRAAEITQSVVAHRTRAPELAATGGG